MPRKPKNVVGPAVAQLRNAQGLSQAALAARCQRLGWDVARDTIAKIEGRSRCVTDAEIVYLAEALKVPYAILLPPKPTGRN
jgi:transcriptional regulator with XRE-family HTH domain